MKTPSPIKRSKSLVLLSRDHHDGLLLAWKIRQGIKLNVEHNRISTYAEKVFDKELEPHFREEEKVLFSQLPDNDELRITAEKQHAELRKKIALFRTSSDVSEADLLRFASLLDEHIRFEERTLFPHIEKTFLEEQLHEIGRQLEEDHATKETVVWQDEFWVKQKNGK